MQAQNGSKFRRKVGIFYMYVINIQKYPNLHGESIHANLLRIYKWDRQATKLNT